MRFAGTIEELGDVDVSQPHDVIASDILSRFYPTRQISGMGVWPMEPGQVHPAHKDEQPPYWIVRIHVPLVTNDGVVFTMNDGDHRMKVGKAYRMNTLATHAVANHGATERLHLIIDVRA